MNRRVFLQTLLGRRNTPPPAQTGNLPAKNSTSAKSAAGPTGEELPARILAEAYGMAVNTAFGTVPAGSAPDYEALLPPDFTPALLRLEAERLGLYTGAMPREEMIREVLRVMGALPKGETM